MQNEIEQIKVTIEKRPASEQIPPELIPMVTAIVQHIAKQYVAQERERCAKIADDYNMLDERPESYTARDIARAIRSGA